MKALLTHRCKVERPFIVNNDGVQKKNWRPHIKRLRCLLQEKTGMVAKLPSGEEVTVDGVLYIPRSADVKPRRADDDQDRITMLKPKPAGTFLVKIVIDQSGRGHKSGCLKAFVIRHKPQTRTAPLPS